MVKDIIITETGDLEFTSGDFTIKNSDEQHAVLLINTKEGSWKQYPIVGVGINDYLGSSGKTSEIKRKVTVQMQSDGYVNVDVALTSDNSGFVGYSINADRL